MSETLKFGNGKWAVKKGSTLAYNDENGNFKPLPFTFDRSTSATRVNKEGLIEVVSNNEPRIDYTNDSNGALLLEPSRSNSITYSEDFSSWIKGEVTVNPNNAISPDGTLNADEVTPNATTSSIRIWQTQTTVASTYSLSFFVKYNGKQYVQLLFGGNLNSDDFSNFDLINGIVTNGTGNIEKYGNGWYRISLIASLNSATDQVYLWSIDSPNAARGASSTGNGIDGYYVWGAQVEQGSYATSYIPTQGSIGTRVAESCSQTPPSGIIGQTELTVFYKGIVERLSGSDGHAIALSQDANAIGSERILLYRSTSDGNMYVFIQDTTIVFSTPLLVNSNPQINDKYAIAIKDNDLVIYCNGVKVAENNSGTIPQMQYIYLNKWNNQINEKNITQEVKLYNTRLSNAELAALTKI